MNQGIVRAGCPWCAYREAGRCLRNAGYQVEKEGHRIADGLNVNRCPSKELYLFSRYQRGAEDDKGNDPQHMGFSKSSMMEDKEPGKAGEDRCIHIGPSEGGVPDDRAKPKKGDNAAKDGDEADDGVDPAKESDPEHSFEF